MPHLIHALPLPRPGYFTLSVALLSIAMTAAAQQAITGSTTWTGPVLVENTEPVPLSQLVGARRVSFGGITLDGEQNVVEIDVPSIDLAVDVETEGGVLTADLHLMEISIVSEGEHERHYVAVAGDWRGASIVLELDFEPGMGAITGSTGLASEPPTAYHLEITGPDGQRWVVEGVAEGPGVVAPVSSVEAAPPVVPPPRRQPSSMEPDTGERFAALHGTVRGPSGAPAIGAKVFVTSDDYRQLLGTAVSMAAPSSGHYQILELPVGVPLRLHAFHDNVPGVLYSKRLTLQVNEFRREHINLELRHRDPGLIGDKGAGMFSVLERIMVLLEQNQRRQWAHDLRGLLQAMAAREQHLTGRAHLLLMIDSSGSMTDNDPGDVRQSVARYVVDRLPPAAAVGILDFDNEAKVLAPVRQGDTARAAARQAIDRIDADGGTDIGQALRGGLPQFQSTAPGAKRAAILLTDGQGNYADEAATYAQLGIILYTVGLGDRCEEDVLQRMAQQTGGLYFKASEAGRLFQSFEAAIVDINDEQTFYTQQGTILPEQHRYLTFDVEVGLDHFVSILTWPGSDLDLRLFGPDGQEAAVTRTAADRYELLTVPNPEPGRWRAEVKAVEVSESGSPYTFTTSAVSPVRLVADGWDAVAAAGGGSLVLRVEGATSLQRLKGTVSVEVDGGNVRSMDLRRGSASGELVGDLNWLSEAGDYTLRVVVEGRHQGGAFRRELHRTLHVAGQAVKGPEQQLIGDLGARDVAVRLRAVKELGRLRSTAARPLIRELLADPSDEVRQAAAWALTRIEQEQP